MSNFAPMHYRKLRIAEHGAFGQLPFLVRGTAAMILKFCDDRGVFALRGKAPVDAVTRKCGAEPSERKAIAKHIEELIDVGYLRYGNDSLIVNEQEEDWEKISSNMIGRVGGQHREGRQASSGRAPNSSRTSSARSGSGSSSRNHSADPLALDKIYKTRSDQEEQKRSSPNGECEGGQAPKTQPNPSLRSIKLDEALGKGPASWGMDGTSLDQDNTTKAQTQTPTPRPAGPFPAARHEPLVAVVDPKPLRLETPTAKGRSRAKVGKAQSGDGRHTIPQDWTVNETNYEHGAKFYGYTKAQVDVEAQSFRDKYTANGAMYVNWDAHFRNHLKWEYERRQGKPPIVPPPREPKIPMPPPPPRHPDVEAAIQRWGDRMANGEQVDLKKLLEPVFRLEPLEEAMGS